MADVVMVVTMVAFVLLCVAYVGWCDRIIERDQAGLDESSTTADAARTPTREEVAA